jgi:hypothetical protein
MANINDLGFPFTSVAGDRQYSASEWREYFDGIMTSGVVANIENGLRVTAQNTPNKTIFVDRGAVVIRGAMRVIPGAINLAIADNASGNPRIDRVVARLNYPDRKIEFVVKQGTPGASPAAPALTRTTTAWELSLARLYLINGYTVVSENEITDERIYDEVCGYSKTIYMQDFDDENNLLKYARQVISTDTFLNPTVVHYKRPTEGTLFLKITYSNPDAGTRFQTITEEYYRADGTTKYKTIVYTITYLSTGRVNTMTREVTSNA